MTEDFIDLAYFNFVDILFGTCDENIYFLKKLCNVNITFRDDKLKISGEKENIYFAKKTIEYIVKSILKGEIVDKKKIEFILNCIKNKNFSSLKKPFQEVICLNFKNNAVITKTISQLEYKNLIEKNIITFGIGPAGTGKTYIAVAKAVAYLKEKTVERIILTRPVVEAGESLGFLPGDFQSKIDPYLRPLYDIMEEILGFDNFNKFLERKKIEIVPLAYMRGRTLNKSFIILDEAQNTTSTQMKMFLTRLGKNSKIVVNGDITQIDLTNKKKSGLVDALKILKNIDSIAIFNFSRKDIIRHELVEKIINAYDEINK